MNKRFVVGLSSSTPEQEQNFVAWLTGSYGWWHWVTNFWIITDTNGLLTAQSLRDKINEVFRDAQTFVIELRDDGTESWAGTVPAAQRDRARDWLNRWWDRQKPPF